MSSINIPSKDTITGLQTVNPAAEAKPTQIQRKPEQLIEDAVRRMMPKNRLSRHLLKNLKVYPGAEHPHAAENPIPL